MNKQEFEKFLHENIPITKAMRVSVLEFTATKVRIGAKLEPNKNDKATAFGGSISSLLTICGWAMVYINMKEADPKAQIVVRRSTIEYLAPIHNDFIAECSLADEESRKVFFEMYDKQGKARIELDVTCSDGQKLFAKYKGQYVAFK